MPQSDTTKLTEKQKYWLGHIEACEQSGQTLKTYAEEKDLSPQRLYNWKARLRAMGILAPNAEAKDRSDSCSVTKRIKDKAESWDVGFAAVRLADAGDPNPGLRIRFLNGIVLELDRAADIGPGFDLLRFLAALS